MTTATETDVDLEHLLDGAPACELLRPHNGQWIPCGRRAEWLIKSRKPPCGHDTVDAVLTCDPCLQDIFDGRRPLQCSGSGCAMWIEIEQVIRL